VTLAAADDGELCDAVMLGVVQLQATFSVVAGRSSIKDRCERRGTHLSKGCTCGTVGLRCVLPLLRVLRFTTIAVPSQSVTLSTRRSQQPVRRAVTHTRRCWCNSDTQYTRGTRTGSLGGSLAREDQG
jgi:hypothetical protein